MALLIFFCISHIISAFSSVVITGPGYIVVVDALPKGPTGKVARLSLAKQLRLTDR
jgi:acyl-coenzyme A synthetase/AMP-(fatty) acid ligase